MGKNIPEVILPGLTAVKLHCFLHGGVTSTKCEATSTQAEDRNLNNGLDP